MQQNIFAFLYVTCYFVNKLNERFEQIQFYSHDMLTYFMTYFKHYLPNDDTRQMITASWSKPEVSLHL